MDFFSYFLSTVNFFFKINFFKKILSRIPSDCQTFLIQIKPLVQTISKSYQQGTQGDKNGPPNSQYMYSNPDTLTHDQNLSSADNFCKQFEPKSGPTKCRS